MMAIGLMGKQINIKINNDSRSDRSDLTFIRLFPLEMNIKMEKSNEK
jgi:hypothetical protein